MGIIIHQKLTLTSGINNVISKATSTIRICCWIFVKNCWRGPKSGSYQTIIEHTAMYLDFVAKHAMSIWEKEVCCLRGNAESPTMACCTNLHSKLSRNGTERPRNSILYHTVNQLSLKLYNCDSTLIWDVDVRSQGNEIRKWISLQRKGLITLPRSKSFSRLQKKVLQWRILSMETKSTKSQIMYQDKEKRKGCLRSKSFNWCTTPIR